MCHFPAQGERLTPPSYSDQGRDERGKGTCGNGAGQTFFPTEVGKMYGEGGIEGDKEIPIGRITSIQFRKADWFTSGHIQFTFPGGKEAEGGALQAVTDENSVMFRPKANDDFLAAKQAIEEQMEATSKPVAAVSSTDGLDQLEKLAALRDKGIISEDEFNAKKRQILGL